MRMREVKANKEKLKKLELKRQEIRKSQIRDQNQELDRDSENESSSSGYETVDEQLIYP